MIIFEMIVGVTAGSIIVRVVTGVIEDVVNNLDNVTYPE